MPAAKKAKTRKKSATKSKVTKKATKSTTSAKKAASKRKASPKSTKKKVVNSSTKKKTAKRSTAKTTVGKKAAAKKSGKKKLPKKTTVKSKVAKKKVAVKAKSTKKKTTAKAGVAKSKTKKKSLASSISVKAGSRKKSGGVASSKKKAAASKVKKSKLKIEKKAISAKATEEAKPNFVPSPSKSDLRFFRKVAKDTKQRIKKAENAKKKVKGFLAKPPSKGRKYSLDLRVHSPGTIGYFTAGGVEPGPALVRLAKVKGLDIVGLTDYYNPSYIDEVQSSAAGSKMTIIPGMDMCCRIDDCEEVYITALFPESFSSVELEEVLVELEVPKSARGRKDFCLTGPFQKTLDIIEGRGGIVIPSRLDKTPYRQLAIPTLVEKYGIHAFDLVHPENPEFFKKYWPSGGFTFFSFSNAHALAQIGSRAKKVKLQNPGFEGLKELVKRRPVGESLERA